MIRRITETLIVLFFLGIIVSVFAPLRAQWEMASGAFSALRDSGFNYDATRNLDLDFRAATEARPYIPEDGRWFVLSKQPMWSEVRARYVLYPNVHKAPKDWDYLIDLTGEYHLKGASWPSVALPCGAMLYARPGKAFRVPPQEIVHSLPLGRSFMVFLFVSVAYLAAGALLLRLIGWRPDVRQPFAFGGIAYLLGFLSLNGILWCGLMIGVPFTRAGVLAMWGLAFVAGMLCLRFRRSATAPALLCSPRPNVPFAAFDIVAAVIALFVVASVLVFTVCMPEISYDALAHWLYKAKALAAHGSLEYMRETNTNDYPLNWSLNAASLFVLAGGAADEMVKWTVGLFLLVIAGQLYSAFRMVGGSRAVACTGLAAFFWYFDHETLYFGYAEAAFMAYTAAILAVFAVWLREDASGPWFPLLLLLLLGLAGIKSEGGPTVVIFAGAYVLAGRGVPWSGARLRRAALIAVPAVLLIAWSIYALRLGGGVQAHFKEPASPERLQLLLTRVLESTVGRDEGWRILAGAGILCCAFVGVPWRNVERFLGVAGAGLVLLVPVALLGWTTDHLNHQTLTATPRLIMHAAPVLLVLVVARLASTLGSRDTDDTIPH